MSMNPWKGWSVNGRSVRVDGSTSSQREWSVDAVGSQDLGLIQPPGCGSPVVWQGWNALRQGTVTVTTTVWTGWSNGRKGSVAPVQPTPTDKNLDNRPSSAFLTGAAASRASAFKNGRGRQERSVTKGP